MTIIELRRKLMKTISFYVQVCYVHINSLPIIPSPRKYNLSICHSKKFIWFKVSKVCNSTIRFHLKENGILEDIENVVRKHYPFCLFKKFFKYSHNPEPWNSYNAFYPINIFKDYFKFAFVRNPWDRLVSCWRQKVSRNHNYFNFEEDEWERMKNFGNFVQWVEKQDIHNCDQHIRSQSSLIDLNHIDFIGRFENFSKDIRTVFEHLKLPIAELAHRNKSSKGDSYKEFYTPELVEKVAEIYKKDIQIFNYKFEND